MSVNRLKATICGTSYTLVSEESLSYMRDLVAQIDSEMTQLLENDRRMSTTMAAVLMAVQYGDKANKESKVADELRVQYKQLLDASERLQDELAQATAEVARLKEEAVQLRQAATEAQARCAPAPVSTPAPVPTPAPVKPPVVTRPLASFEEILDEEEL